MIDQQTIEKIKDAAQIVDVVSDFVSLRRRGVNYVGLCPFHNDKSPSFYVSPTKNFCKCFACNSGGNPISFLMQKENLSYQEALRWLARKYNIDIEERKMTAEERQRQTDREGMFALNEFAQQCFEDDLYNTPEGRNIGLAYFRERGLQDETIKRFHLGYALERKTDLAERALQKGHKREYLLDQTGVGLCYGDDPKRTPICRFAGRVIFPHHSLSGRCIAFGGRILQRVDHAFKKYVNSPESAIYHKSDLPYGLFEAKNAIAKSDHCYVVEGNVDVLSMSQAGFQNVIAASGTALTSEHIAIVKRFTRNVTLMFDSDTAGITAAMKSIDLLLSKGMNVKLLLLPTGEDPDSFCRKNAASDVEKYFNEHAVDFVTFKTEQLLGQINPRDPFARGQALQQVANSITLVEDHIISSILVGQVSQLFHVDEREVMQAVNKGKQDGYANEVRRQEMERRREIERREREELGIAETASDTAPTAPSQPDNNATVPTQEDIPSAQQPITPAQQQPAATPPRAALLTDRYEREIIRNLVRYGSQTFIIKSVGENGQPIEQQWRVVDFIANELAADQIMFAHPLYARMLQVALDASADPNVAWDSVRFFCDIVDDQEIAKAVFDMIEDRYEGMGIASRQESLELIIPRCILELKDAIVTTEQNELQAMLRQPGADFQAIFGRLQQLGQIKAALAKELGERIIARL